MKCLMFTAESPYARFRRPYTTTSALTFSVMHPIAVKGMTAALMGIEYGNLYDYTANMRIAIQVLNPVHKDMQSFNLIAQANNNKAPSFQSRVEFLRDVKYRIFITDDEKKLLELKTVLESHEFVFTPYLGCSEHIAKIIYEGIQESQLINDGKFADTIVPAENVQIDECAGFTIYADRIPVGNNRDKEYTEYLKVIFSNQRLSIRDLILNRVGEYNVFFL